MAGQRKTHCVRGHARTPENLDANRACRRCKAERELARYHGRAAPPLVAPVDPEVRAHVNARRRKRYAENAAAREAHLRQKRERYRQDAEYRARRLKQMVDYKRDRLANDPVWAKDYRERERFRNSDRRRRMGVPENPHKRGTQSRNEGERLNAAPLRAWLAAWEQNHPDQSRREFAMAVGISDRRLYSIRSGERKTTTLTIVSQVLDMSGASDDLALLYPVDGTAPILPELRHLRVLPPPTTCRSGDVCPRPNGHGPNGRFCTIHGAELDRIAGELRAEADTKMTKLNKGRAAANRLKSAAVAA